MDIDVPADKALPQGTLGPLTRCSYSMKSLEWVQVFVYQPPFTAQAAKHIAEQGVTK